MSTLTDRSGTALLVVDAQQQVLEGSHARAEVVANIATLVGRARGAGVEVVWVQHESQDLVRDSEGWQLVPELSRADGEALVLKTYGDSFEATDLEEVLAERQVGRLVVAGAQTDACIRATLHGALTRGYDALLVADAHSTEDLTAYGAPPPDQVIAHTNLYWSYTTAPGRTAGTAPTAEVDFAGAS